MLLGTDGHFPSQNIFGSISYRMHTGRASNSNPKILQSSMLCQVI